MKKELLYVLETMSNPFIMKTFIDHLTLEDKETISHLLPHLSSAS